MYRKDYLQRQFEAFGKVLAMILGYKGTGDWDKFEAEINAAAKKFADTELPAMETTEPDAFRALVEGSRYSAEQKKILANLLFEKLSFYSEKGNQDELKRCGEKALALYRYLESHQLGVEFDLDISYKLKALAALGFS